MEKINVLFIEDDEAYLEYLKRNICKHTFNCFFAKTLQKSIEIIETKNIELILLDSTDGNYSVNQIRSKCNLPIIVLSNLNNKKEESLKLDINDFISKDELTRESLINCSKKAVNKSRRILKDKADEIINKLSAIEKSLIGAS